ncbi:hypothetical protein AB0C15_26375 [Micromonospora sp. NPDC048835]|uniref:hypothetical protein n=1 Tax=Micromonospora sp. NPDC048835 TaxID=3155147 RepID=UPI0034014170
MNDELRITVAGISDLPAETRQALHDILARRGRDLLDEAGRLEAGVNAGVGPPMITPAILAHADTWRMMGYSQGRNSKGSRNWTLISGMATFVGGYFTNNLTRPWGAIGFVICALVALYSFNKGSE